MPTGDSSHKVTVVVPAYNMGQYVEECLDSLLAQTLPGIQVLVIDDCSADSTRELAGRYADQHDMIDLIPFDENCGVSACRNFGLERAQGEYIFFLDADDLLAEKAMESLYLAAREGEADLVRGNGVFFMADEPHRLMPYENVKTVSAAHGLDYRRDNFHGIPYYHTLFLFKVEFLRRHGIKYPLIRLGEDPIFLLEALVQADRISTISEVVYKYRRGLERKEHLEDLDKVNDFFHHLVRMRELWVDHEMADRWLEYFDKTFWWPWETFITRNPEALRRNLPTIRDLLCSLPLEYVDFLSKERFLHCCAGKVATPEEITRFAAIIAGTTGGPEEGHKSREEDPQDELLRTLTSRSWKYTRPFRRAWRRLQAILKR
jgi:glycosyltransferase involved in cell wall biosynthesis